MRKALLVEDDASICETLSVTLSYRGFEVAVADSVAYAKRLLELGSFDVAILDVSLPDGDGFLLCREIRSVWPRLPILMLTARSDESSAVRGLECGADDYVRKPCGLDELTARLNRLVGRNGEQETYVFRSIQLDRSKRQVRVADHTVQLRRGEYELLVALMRRPGEIVSRETLLEAIDRDEDLFDRAIDSHISRLRGKLREAGLNDARVASVYGVGYRLESA